MAERVVYSHDGKPIGRLRIPGNIEQMLWERRTGERVRMRIREPLDIRDIEDVDILRPIRMPVIDLSVRHWIWVDGKRKFGPIIAGPLDMVEYQMALQAEEDAEAEALARPSETAYNAWAAATAVRQRLRDKIRNCDQC